MKRCLLVLVVIGLIAIPATSCLAVNKSNTGCGLGSYILKDSDSLVLQVLAVTTNGIFGNQTFAITSGTLDCEQPSKIVSRERVNTFVADNMDNLATDIARGHGEYLNTLAVLMEVPEDSRADFYVRLQSNFSTIYSSPQVNSTEVVSSIESLM
ncbi:MAG: DUF3015 family protein [Desulfomonilia bacterium]|jgi:hypothetical protein